LGLPVVKANKKSQCYKIKAMPGSVQAAQALDARYTLHIQKATLSLTIKAEKVMRHAAVLARAYSSGLKKAFVQNRSEVQAGIKPLSTVLAT
jgi:hypothetical protein